MCLSRSLVSGRRAKREAGAGALSHTDGSSQTEESEAGESILDQVWAPGSNEGGRLFVMLVIVGRARETERGSV